MDIVAHALWAAAGATLWKRRNARVPVPAVAAWAMFPDILAFGPPVVVGLWMRIGGQAPTGHGGLMPHVHLGLPLYPMGHSLVVFAAAYALVSLALRRPALGLLGWLTHILIDIPTHSHSYYATRFLWPFSDFGIDGIAWWTRWFWVCTYLGLAVVYYVLWRKGYIRGAKPYPGPCGNAP